MKKNELVSVKLIQWDIEEHQNKMVELLKKTLKDSVCIPVKYCSRPYKEIIAHDGSVIDYDTIIGEIVTFDDTSISFKSLVDVDLDMSDKNKIIIAVATSESKYINPDKIGYAYITENI